jgi:hypothetical protein
MSTPKRFETLEIFIVTVKVSPTFGWLVEASALTAVPCADTLLTKMNETKVQTKNVKAIITINLLGFFIIIHFSPVL